MAVGLVIVFVAIFGRMDYMVRAQGDTYAETAAARSTKTIPLYGMRGTIYDTNMVPLAYDEISYNVTFYRDPSRTSEEDRAALVERIETRHGLRQLTYMQELGVGNVRYRLIDIDHDDAEISPADAVADVVPFEVE